ncbi:hypothetical protein EDB89DRAFT_2242300 [Lactarius sanguifluus]|nr:hypothetical protein EDB89DRAFT_2242300 [Lactarius sanguifluus]
MGNTEVHGSTDAADVDGIVRAKWPQTATAGSSLVEVPMAAVRVAVRTTRRWHQGALRSMDASPAAVTALVLVGVLKLALLLQSIGWEVEVTTEDEQTMKAGVRRERAGTGEGGGCKGAGNGSVSGGEWVGKGMGGGGDNGGRTNNGSGGEDVGNKPDGGSEWASGGMDDESGGHESGREGEWVDGSTRGEGKGEGENAGGESDGGDGGKGVPLARVIKLLGQRGRSDGAAESRLWLFTLRAGPGSSLNVRGGSVSYYLETEVHVRWLGPSRWLLEALDWLLCKGCARTHENVFKVEEGVMV